MRWPASRSGKAALILGGYLAAVVAAVGAGWLYDLRVSRLPFDTSGGMYAAGQSMTALAAFLVVALVPTLLGLWFLRRHTRLWNGIAIVSIAFAGVGLIAVVATMVARAPGRSVPLMVLELLGLAQMLGVPFWFGAFVLFAFLAPTPGARRGLIAAVAIEAVIGVCSLVHWLGH